MANLGLLTLYLLLPDSDDQSQKQAAQLFWPFFEKIKHRP